MTEETQVDDIFNYKATHYSEIHNENREISETPSHPSADESTKSYLHLQNVPVNTPETRNTTPHSSRCNCQDEVLKAIEELKNNFTELITQMTQTIIQLRKEVRALKMERSLEDPLDKEPKLPFTSVQEFLNFEKKISDDLNNFEKLQVAFFQRGYSDPTKFVKNSLRMIFSDEVAREFCWLRKKNKKSARSLRVITALKNSFHQKFPATPDDVFDKLGMRHFQYANDRLTKKQKYQPKNHL